MNDVVLFGDKATDLPESFKADAGMGNENVDTSALAIPQLKLLQALSEGTRTVEGAREGKILNTLDNKLYDEVYVVNLYMTRTFVIWRGTGRDSSRVGEYNTEAAATSAVGTMESPEQLRVVETHTHYVIQLDPETAKVIGPARIFMSSSALTPSKAWNTQIVNKKDAPRFAGVWRLSTEQVSNSKGSWSNWLVDFAGYAPEDIYLELKESYNSIKGQADDNLLEAADNAA